MLAHCARRLTLRWAKIGPPRRGCHDRPRGSVAAFARANQPALRATPPHGACHGNHGVQIWSNRGLGTQGRKRVSPAITGLVYWSGDDADCPR